MLVNAGRDELMFRWKSGGVQRVVIEVAAGASAQIDAPAEPVARPAPPKPLKLEQPRPAKLEPERAKPARVEPARVEPERAARLPARALATVRFVEEPRSRTMSRIGIGLVAGAVVAGGIAGGLGYLANRDYDRAREIGCGPDGRCPIGPAADLAERSNDRARLAQISAIGGGALLATGAVMWIVGRGQTRRAAPEISLRVGPSSTAIGWRF